MVPRGGVSRRACRSGAVAVRRDGPLEARLGRHVLAVRDPDLVLVGGDRCPTAVDRAAQQAAETGGDRADDQRPERRPQGAASGRATTGWTPTGVSSTPENRTSAGDVVRATAMAGSPQTVSPLPMPAAMPPTPESQPASAPAMNKATTALMA